MSQTIFGDPVPVPLRCDQCGLVRTDCVALDDMTTAVTGRTFLCVPCADKNTKRLLRQIMSEGDAWKEETS